MQENDGCCNGATGRITGVAQADPAGAGVQWDTLRLQLLKIGAHVRVTVSAAIWVALSD